MLEDFLILIGFLPIVKPEKVEYGEPFLRILTREEVKENRKLTEKLLKLVNQAA